MADRTFAAAIASAPRQKLQHEHGEAEWADLIAAMVEDRARRRRRHEIGTALLACAFVIVAAVAAVAAFAS
jgi:hypothetical protein